MDPVIAKAIVDLGIAFVCGAVVISLFILLFKRFLSNSATDRSDLLAALQRQLDFQQSQIAELRREVRKMREDKDIWFHRALDLQERTAAALMSVVEVNQWCRSGRNGAPPKGPSESDCFPQDMCDSCSTTTANEAVEVNK